MRIKRMTHENRNLFIALRVVLLSSLAIASLYISGKICLFLFFVLVFKSAGNISILIDFGILTVIPFLVASIVSTLDGWLCSKKFQMISAVLLGIRWLQTILIFSTIWIGFTLASGLLGHGLETVHHDDTDGLLPLVFGFGGSFVGFMIATLLAAFQIARRE